MCSHDQRISNMINGKNSYSKKIKFYGEVIYLFKSLFSFIGFLTLITYITQLEFPSYIPLQICLGVLYLHMKELQHEALHNPTRWKNLNRIVGVLFGMPMLISYSDYQYHHMLHHKYTGTHEDTEYFSYNKKSSSNLLNFILGIFMLEHYVNNFKKMFEVLFFNKMLTNSPMINRKIKQEYFLTFVILFGFVGISFYYENFLLFKIWLIPLFLFTLPLNVLIELPEHMFCEKNNENIFLNTRTIKSNFLISWIVNGNNYHVEHHCAPHYPISLLSKLHKKIRPEITFYNKSYFNFYAQFFKKIKK